MILLHLNKNSTIPLFQQVIDQLKDKIDHNALKPGEILPPTRVFSHQLGVHRSTIYKAYQELWALGYIESRSGSYSYVRRRRELISQKTERASAPVAWAQKINPNAEKVYSMFGAISFPFSENTGQFDGIDFGRLHPDGRIFPIKEYKSCVNTILSEHGERYLDYGESKGLLSLRDFIAARMRSHAIDVSAEEILITNGAQHAIDLLAKLFAKPGARVFVESPTYGMIIPTLTYYGCDIVPIPMRDDGVDLEVTEQEFKRGFPIFFYTMPNFQNPSGITTTQEHREKLIALCEKYQIPIIEDAFEEEMKYFGSVPLPIKSMDHQHIVFYVGSFSKILFPGIRLGWIAGNRECIQRLTALKRFNDLSTAVPMQAALAEFCRKGYYELHIKRVHKIYRKRMMHTMQMLRSTINNANVTWIDPNGGFTVWLTMKQTKVDYDAIAEIFTANKIRLAAGKDFFPVPAKEIHFRMAISTLNEDEISEGITRLATAITQIYRVI